LSKGEEDTKDTKKTERATAGFAVYAFKPSSSSSCSSWVSGLLTNFVFSWLPFVISMIAFRDLNPRYCAALMALW